MEFLVSRGYVEFEYDGQAVPLENFSMSLLGPYRDALCPLLIFLAGAHSSQNLEAQ